MSYKLFLFVFVVFVFYLNSVEGMYDNALPRPTALYRTIGTRQNTEALRLIEDPACQVSSPETIICSQGFFSHTPFLLAFEYSSAEIQEQLTRHKKFKFPYEIELATKFGYQRAVAYLIQKLHEQACQTYECAYGAD